MLFNSISYLLKILSKSCTNQFLKTIQGKLFSHPYHITHQEYMKQLKLTQSMVFFFHFYSARKYYSKKEKQTNIWNGCYEIQCYSCLTKIK